MQLLMHVLAFVFASGKQRFGLIFRDGRDVPTASSLGREKPWSFENRGEASEGALGKGRGQKDRAAGEEDLGGEFQEAGPGAGGRAAAARAGTARSG